MRSCLWGCVVGLWSVVIAGSALAQTSPALPGAEAIVWQRTDKGLPKAEVWRWDGSQWQKARSSAEVSWPVDGVLWTLKTQARVVPYTECSCLTEEETQADKPPARCRKRATVQVPLASTPGRQTVLIEVPKDLTGEDGPGSLEFQVLGAVGPYVLMASHSFGYQCGGAHGGEEANFRVVDLRTGKAVTPWTPQFAASVVAQTKGALLADVRKSGEELLDSEVSVSAWRNGWRAGQWSPQWLITGNACFACSDGVWGSYTRSLWVANGTFLPPIVAPYARLEPPLALLSAKVPGAIGLARLPAPSADGPNDPRRPQGPGRAPSPPVNERL